MFDWAIYNLMEIFVQWSKVKKYSPNSNLLSEETYLPATNKSFFESFTFLLNTFCLSFLASLKVHIIILPMQCVEGLPHLVKELPDINPVILWWVSIPENIVWNLL